MITARCLKTFDPFPPTQIKTDASAVGVGNILEQQHAVGWHVIAFALRMLDKNQKSYTTFEKSYLQSCSVSRSTNII